MRALLLLGRILIAVVVAALIAYAVNASGAQLRPAAPSLFEDRLAAYVSLRTELARVAELPLEPNDERTAAARRWRLGLALRNARSGVPQGNIFSGAVATFFRQTVAESLNEEMRVWVTARANAAAATARARVNAPLPMGAGHDVHAALLHVLPPLPRGIEYRVLQFDLVLWDLQADVVIDVLPGVFATTTV